jgi:hypothetical protein
MLDFSNQANAYRVPLTGKISIMTAYTTSYVQLYSTISAFNTRIQDIHTLLTEQLELNSQFGDLSQFVNYGSTGENVSTTETDPNFLSVEVPSVTEASQDDSSHLPPQ